MGNIVNFMLVKELLCDHPWGIRNNFINPPASIDRQNDKYAHGLKLQNNIKTDQGKKEEEINSFLKQITSISSLQTT